MAKTKKPAPIEELPRLDASEAWRVAVTEERLASEAYERILAAARAADKEAALVSDPGSAAAIAARRRLARAACREMGRRAELGPSKGSVHPDRRGEMSVLLDGPETDIVFTVAHEARHLWQYAQGWPARGRLDGTGSPEYVAAEADANDYAYRMLSRFMGER